jgi:hypothetical protein
LSAAEHTASGIADAPDGLSQPLAEAADRLANTLAHAADRLPQALTEAADRLPQAIRQPAKQATAACRLLRLGRLLRLHRLLRYSRLHWLLRNRLLHGLLHGLLHRLLYRLLYRLLRRGLLGLLHDLLRLLLGWLSRLRVLSGLLRRLLGCLLRLIHLIWGHALRIGFALGVTLVRHGFLLAPCALTLLTSRGDATAPCEQTAHDSATDDKTLVRAMLHPTWCASSMPAAVWPSRSLSAGSLRGRGRAPRGPSRTGVAHFLRLPREAHGLARDGALRWRVEWPIETALDGVEWRSSAHGVAQCATESDRIRDDSLAVEGGGAQETPGIQGDSSGTTAIGQGGKEASHGNSASGRE